MRIYPYVGPKDLLDLIDPCINRIAVKNAVAVREWIKHTQQELDSDNSVIATYIIDTNRIMWICDRHMEHVVCAIGRPVLSAGEITFRVDKNVETTYITNQSTGYCPEPASWEAVNLSLKNTDISYPNHFSVKFNFRICSHCKTINIIKENDYVCAVCDHRLNKKWNLDIV